MLALAVEKAQGAFTNFLPLSGLPRSSRESTAPPDDFELLCRFFCVPGEREQVEPMIRFMFSSYITVPVYAAFYRWLGHGDAIAPMCEAWEAGDRQKAAAEAPWELIEDMFILGSPEQMRERLDAFVDGGITLPILTTITTPDKLGELIDASASIGRRLGIRCRTKLGIHASDMLCSPCSQYVRPRTPSHRPRQRGGRGRGRTGRRGR